MHCVGSVELQAVSVAVFSTQLSGLQHGMPAPGEQFVPRGWQDALVVQVQPVDVAEQEVPREMSRQLSPEQQVDAVAVVHVTPFPLHAGVQTVGVPLHVSVVVQHCEAEVQAAPSATHGGVPHFPEVQTSGLQHWLLVVQVPPLGRHCCVPQFP